MPAIGPWELVVILLIVVVVFGAGRLSQVGGALGKSIKEFRKATSEEPDVAAITTATATPVSPPAAPVPVTSGATVVVVENKCPSCATVNPPGQTFCGQCGTRLTRAA